MREQEPRASAGSAKEHPLEDRALKRAAKIFGEELMPLVGIKEKVRRIAPTEQVHLKLKDLMEDFNYEMEDGSWTHLEFEGRSIRVKTLRKFRVYEAVASEQYGVDVTTCVICSSGVKKLRNKLTTGINTYRVKIIRLKDRSADRTLQRLEQKQKEERLTRADLLELLLTPLMSGSLSQEERIRRGIKLLKGERSYMDPEELSKLEAVLYTFALKFLNGEQLKKIKEEMNMTILGEMILQDGIEKGRKEGRKEGRRQGRRQGRREGGAQVNHLNRILIKANRYDDLKRAAEDRAFQKQLMKELLSEKH